MLDTNVLIELRDGAEEIEMRVAALATKPSISIISRVELEAGLVSGRPADRFHRGRRLKVLLGGLETLPFGNREADAYRTILALAGFSRRKAFDRMIAAQALVHRATLVTLNAPDFADVPGLQVLGW